MHPSVHYEVVRFARKGRVANRRAEGGAFISHSEIPAVCAKTGDHLQSASASTKMRGELILGGMVENTRFQ